jgi:hypothetical protein
MVRKCPEGKYFDKKSESCKWKKTKMKRDLKPTPIKRGKDKIEYLEKLKKIKKANKRL